MCIPVRDSIKKILHVTLTSEINFSEAITSPSRRFFFLIFLFLLMPFLLGQNGCGSSSDDDNSYPETIQEGRAAAMTSLNQTGATSISLAFSANGREVWAETFGVTDKETQKQPALETMYGIGSVSKMFAAISIMILVDEGKVDLDDPVFMYIPDFSMLPSDYDETHVTVRMLLNHSSGFPGNDQRNALTTTPFHHYADQIVQTLQQERLKHEPGFMQTYCNDGFSLLEKVVANVSGMSFVDFVQEKIFDPLGMEHSRYALTSFDPDQYAHTYTGDVENPQHFVNLYASGGLNTTPTDMMNIAMMLYCGGKVGNVRILSPEAVQEMAIDQTLDKFHPVLSENDRYGLGWDSVSQPGLKAVDINSWMKGGDTLTYGTSLIVVPEIEMGVLVTGASNYGSGEATVVAEKILLRALAEQGHIPSFPQPLPNIPTPSVTPLAKDLEAIQGYFANSSNIFKITVNAESSITLSGYVEGAWKEQIAELKMRDNGHFSSDEQPLTEFYSVTSEYGMYLAVREAKGNQHYQNDSLLAQKITAQGPLSQAWSERTGKKWLAVNFNPDSVFLTGGERLTILQIEGLEGLICVSPQEGSYSILDPSQSDSRGSMMLFLPQEGRDQNDLFVFDQNGEEWLRFGSYVYRPLESVPELTSSVFSIGPQGYAQWYSLDSEELQKTVDITSNSDWKIYDPEFNVLTESAGPGQETLPAASGKYYFLFFGEPGDIIQADIFNG